MPRPALTPRFFALQLLVGMLAGVALSLLPENFFATLPFDLCLFQLLFHHACPGCGTLRGLSHLAHGHWVAAWASNPLVYVWLVVGVVAELYLVYQVFCRRDYARLSHDQG